MVRRAEQGSLERRRSEIRAEVAEGHAATPTVDALGGAVGAMIANDQMTAISAIGYVAAICSTLSFAPQAWKIIKSRETKDISVGMYALTVLGFVLWAAYGIALKQWPIVGSNAICLLLSAFILMMKMLPQSKKEQVADGIENV
jgi:MtN3 and saliva related transmembrane protein